MFPFARRFAATVTLLAFAAATSGGLTGCCAADPNASNRAAARADSNRHPEYVQLAGNSNNPLDAAAILTVNGVIFAISALTGGYPLAPNDDEKSPFEDPSVDLSRQHPASR